MKKISHRKASESDERIAEFCELYLFGGKSSLDAYIITYSSSLLKSKASMLVSQPAVQKKLLDLVVAEDDKRLKKLENGVYLCELKNRVQYYVEENGIHPVQDYQQFVLEGNRKSNPLRNLVKLYRLHRMFEFIDREVYVNKINEAIQEEEAVLETLKEKNKYYWEDQAKKYRSQIIKEKFNK